MPGCKHGDDPVGIPVAKDLEKSPDSLRREQSDGRMHMNITLNIDEEIVKKVRKIAIDKDTTLRGWQRAMP